jgi:hypothetical protein|tara:strand:+ start:3924 stop:4181 length:258 start_codon:yes stop_codon:yes gene_type:complete
MSRMIKKDDSLLNRDEQSVAEEHGKPPSLLQVIASVLAAFFGVQSSKNKERDFKHGNHKVFILVGVAMTFAFLLTVVAVVQIVLS